MIRKAMASGAGEPPDPGQQRLHGRVATLEQELTKLDFARRVGSTRISPARPANRPRLHFVSVARSVARAWCRRGSPPGGPRSEAARRARDHDPDPALLRARGLRPSALVRWIYKLRRLIVIDRVPDDSARTVGVTIDRDWAGTIRHRERDDGRSLHLLTEGAIRQRFAGSVYIAPTSESGRAHYASPIVDLETSRKDRRRESSSTASKGSAIAAERLPPPTVVREGSAPFGRSYARTIPGRSPSAGSRLHGASRVAFLFVAIAFLQELCVTDRRARSGTVSRSG
ncbi:MAG: hypothetical protein R2862_01085 [Thermoanaerobaculia bacterium]